MKTLEGRVTVLIRDAGVFVEVYDTKSSRVFVKAEIDKENALRMLGGLARVPAVLEVSDLSKVGKLMEVDILEFEVPASVDSKSYAVSKAKVLCPEGWEPDLYFNSKSSFRYSEGKHFARTSIRRWVDE